MALTLPTCNELKAELADELGEDSTDTDVMNRIERWLNDTWEDIQARQSDWKWTRVYRQVALVPPYLTGTVDVVNGSTTVTGAGTTWLTSWRNRVFWVEGSATVYKVASVDSDSQLTLETAYQEDSATLQVYTLVQNAYPLDNEAFEAGVVGIIIPISNTPLIPMGIEEFMRRYPVVQTIGDPSQYAIWGQEEQSQVGTGAAPLIFPNSFPSVGRILTYFYHRQYDRISGSQKFPIPMRYQRLVLGTGVRLRCGKFDNETTQDLRAEFEGYLKLMILDNTRALDRKHGFKETDVSVSESGNLSFPNWYPDMGDI